jgi:hypothetical protein
MRDELLWSMKGQIEDEINKFRTNLELSIEEKFS